MQEVDFYKLSRAVQDRFIASAHGAGDPRPLLKLRAPRSVKSLAWFGASAACLTAIALLMALGFGRLLHDFAHQPPVVIVLYALGLAGAVACALEGVAEVRRSSVLPFRARIYLFPAVLIDASTRLLRSYPLDAGARWEHLAGVLRVRPDASPSSPSFDFPVDGPSLAADVAAALSDARERIAAAGPKDAAVRGPLDPLIDIGVVNPFAATSPHLQRDPWWLMRRRWLAPLLGLLLAACVWWVRNAASDRAMLHAAQRDGRAQAYRAYLDRGGRSEMVPRIWLPRAELAEVVQRGNVSAIERFAEQHPDSPIRNEIEAALRDAMLRELQLAQAPGTVAALREFARAHPSRRISAELESAVHAIYASALARYRNEAPSDGQMLSFIERLFGFLEAHGPTVEVRFRRKTSRSLHVADAAIKKSPFFMGTVSLPSQYFDERRARARERTVLTELKERFGASFASDIVNLVDGSPLDEGDLAAAPITVPTMFIEHLAEVSGPSYLSNNPRGVFVGLGLVFEATFRIPGDNKPQKFRLSAWRPPDLHVSRKDDSFESAVYDAMANNGYSQFSERYLATFFARQRPRAQN